MTAPEPRRSLEERARLGSEVYERVVRPLLRPEDTNKFVAVDMLSGEYELDPSELAVILRLRARVPTAEIWLGRVGHPAAHKLRHKRFL